jgi:hypothetical protein
MAAITDIDVFEVGPNPGLKTIIVQSRNTVDAADTIAVTLTDHGISATGLLIVEGWKHTTDASIIVEENPTTAVSAGVLTITVPSGTDDDARVYRITGAASPLTFS